MLSFYIQSNRHQKPRQINVLLSKPSRSSFSHANQYVSHFLCSCFSSCFQKGVSQLVTCLQLIPSLNLTSVFGLFSVRCFQAECIFHTYHHSKKKACHPCMYRGYKLKAHNYPSQRSEDSDPVTDGRRKHGSQTMQEKNLFHSSVPCR